MHLVQSRDPSSGWTFEERIGGLTLKGRREAWPLAGIWAQAGPLWYHPLRGHPSSWHGGHGSCLCSTDVCRFHFRSWRDHTPAVTVVLKLFPSGPGHQSTHN